METSGLHVFRHVRLDFWSLLRANQISAYGGFFSTGKKMPHKTNKRKRNSLQMRNKISPLFITIRYKIQKLIRLTCGLCLIDLFSLPHYIGYQYQRVGRQAIGKSTTKNPYLLLSYLFHFMQII